MVPRTSGFLVCGASRLRIGRRLSALGLAEARHDIAKKRGFSPGPGGGGLHLQAHGYSSPRLAGSPTRSSASVNRYRRPRRCLPGHGCGITSGVVGSVARPFAKNPPPRTAGKRTLCGFCFGGPRPGTGGPFKMGGRMPSAPLPLGRSLRYRAALAPTGSNPLAPVGQIGGEYILPATSSHL